MPFARASDPPLVRAPVENAGSHDGSMTRFVEVIWVDTSAAAPPFSFSHRKGKREAFMQFYALSGVRPVRGQGRAKAQLNGRRTHSTSSGPT